MNKITYILACFVLLLVTSCDPNWEDHYGPGSDEASVVSPLNLLDYLKTQPNYSKFVEVLERTKVAEELTRDQYLSVWALDNDAMELLGLMDRDEEYIMQFHINNLSFGLSKLKHGQRLRSLNGKYIPVKMEGGEDIFVANARIVRPNQFCKNGVVHEINELMVPVESIYDFLHQLGDDYSIIRDSIFVHNDTVFDATNSIPIGVDKSGNTIYDSVFVIQNPVFENVDLRSEFIQATMFLPNNQVIEDCFQNLREQYAEFGKEFTEEDEQKAFSWIKDAIFFDKVIDNYGSQLDIQSAFGKTWRTSVQQVSPQPRIMSNGLVYDVTFLKIPNNVHITAIKQLFHYWEFVSEAQKPELFDVANALTITTLVSDNVTFPTINLSWAYRILKLTGDLVTGSPISIDFTPVRLENTDGGTISTSVVMVPPGEYTLYMGFQSSNHPFINVYFNGESVASGLNVEPSTPWNYDRSTNTYPGTRWDGLGGLVGTVTVPGTEMTSFRLKIEFARLGKGSVEELKLYHWALVPTANNY